MRTQQQDPYGNAGATDIQQLNPNGPDQRQSIEPQIIVFNMFRPEPSFRLQLKREVVNCDWVNHQAYTLSHKHVLCRITCMLYPVRL